MACILSTSKKTHTTRHKKHSPMGRRGMLQKCRSIGLEEDYQKSFYWVAHESLPFQQASKQCSPSYRLNCTQQQLQLHIRPNKHLYELLSIDQHMIATPIKKQSYHICMSCDHSHNTSELRTYLYIFNLKSKNCIVPKCVAYNDWQ